MIIAHVLSWYKNKKEYSKNIFFYIIILLIIIPAFLIFIQPDPGSSIIFSSFILTLYREGLSIYFIIFCLFSIFLFLASIKISSYIIITFFLSFILILIFLFDKKIFLSNFFLYFTLLILFSLFSIFSPIIFKKILKPHHRNRIEILFQNEFDKKYRSDIGYNLLYSKTAIGSGRFFGKGYKKGMITKGKFVPEQHTDYIFCTVGEEWGFLGSTFFVILYLFLIGRIYFLSEKQINLFGRIFGYSVGNIFFIHLSINLGMVLGLFPTIGIVLPFFSYGGSSIWSFTILLFLFIRINSFNQVYFNK